MDDVSLRTMQQFLRKYLDQNTPLNIIDVGAAEVQGGLYPTYRSLISPPWNYFGLDIEPGKNVDIVVDSDNWDIHGEYDVVISGQLLEHVENPFAVMAMVAEALKPGGITIHIMPSTGPLHFFPIDAWRIQPDGARALAKWSGLEVIEVAHRNDSIWTNVILVARKPGNEV